MLVSISGTPRSREGFEFGSDRGIPGSAGTVFGGGVVFTKMVGSGRAVLAGLFERREEEEPVRDREWAASLLGCVRGG